MCENGPIDARTAALLALPTAKGRTAADEMNMSELHEACESLERLALHAACLTSYLDQRRDSGYGDQGHEAAAKAAARTGRILWTRAFGYVKAPPMQF